MLKRKKNQRTKNRKGEKKKMKKNNNYQHRLGLCPVCQGNLTYKNEWVSMGTYSGNKSGDAWKCHSCGSKGIEWSMFIEHEVTFRTQEEVTGRGHKRRRHEALKAEEKRS